MKEITKDKERRKTSEGMKNNVNKRNELLKERKK